MLWAKENDQTHIFDPCWKWVRRLLAEEESSDVPADGSKTGSEKPPEDRVNATLEKVNPKWS